MSNLYSIQKANMRYCYNILLIDTSPSVMYHLEHVKNTVCDFLIKMHERNQTAEDVQMLVQLRTFNDDVNILNPEFLPPNQVLDLIDDSTFKCQGCTDLTKAIDSLDSTFSRSSVLYSENIHSADPLPFTLIFTDFEGTDIDSEREHSLNRLMNNRLYTQSVRLAVYVGSESQKNKVEVLAGGRDRVIAFEKDSDLGKYLTPVFLGSTINLNLATHATGELNTAEVAQSVKERCDEGAASAEYFNSENMTNQDLRDNISRMLKKAGF